LVGFLTGYILTAYGLKPYPFYLGIAFSLLGLVISVILIKNINRFTDLELSLEKEKQPKREQRSKTEEKDGEQQRSEAEGIKAGYESGLSTSYPDW
jgi:hypothetical protein